LSFLMGVLPKRAERSLNSANCNPSKAAEHSRTP
jgi:hypothetical protein